MADEVQNIDRELEAATEFLGDLVTLKTPGIFDYVRDVGNRIPALKAQMKEEVKAKFGIRSLMATDHVVCEFLAMMVTAIQAKKVLEVGVFCGFSSLSIAEALPAGGHLYALDISEEYTSIARKYWEIAGVQDKITLTLAPAKETMERYIAEGQAGSYDLVYIDADKEGELEYYELALQLLRPGGIVLIDNALWFGTVVQPHPMISQSSIDAIRALNAFIHTDERVRQSLLPLYDGVMMAIKK